MSDRVQPGQLERELVFDDDGHLTLVGLTALCDGEAALVPGALEHTEACDACTARLGAAALDRLAVQDSFAALAEREAVRRASVAPVSPRFVLRALPGRAVAAALLVAAAAALPMAVRAVRAGPGAVFDAAPVLLRSALVLGRTTMRELEPHATTASLAATAILIVLGLAIARARPRRAANDVSRTETEGGDAG